MRCAATVRRATISTWCSAGSWTPTTWTSGKRRWEKSSAGKIDILAGMDRRQFLSTSAGLALSSAAGYAAQVAGKTRRVGLIGCGWYGKCDLFRLIQVAPVEVVSLCDVDRNMLSQAAEMTASRQASKRKPRTYSDYREMLKEKDLDIVLV